MPAPQRRYNSHLRVLDSLLRRRSGPCEKSRGDWTGAHDTKTLSVDTAVKILDGSDPLEPTFERDLWHLLSMVKGAGRLRFPSGVIVTRVDCTLLALRVFITATSRTGNSDEERPVLPALPVILAASNVSSFIETHGAETTTASLAVGCDLSASLDPMAPGDAATVLSNLASYCADDNMPQSSIGFVQRALAIDAHKIAAWVTLNHVLSSLRASTVLPHDGHTYNASDCALMVMRLRWADGLQELEPRSYWAPRSAGIAVATVVCMAALSAAAALVSRSLRARA